MPCCSGSFLQPCVQAASSAQPGPSAEPGLDSHAKATATVSNRSTRGSHQDPSPQPRSRAAQRGGSAADAAASSGADRQESAGTNRNCAEPVHDRLPPQELASAVRELAADNTEGGVPYSRFRSRWVAKHGTLLDVEGYGCAAAQQTAVVSPLICDVGLLRISSTVPLRVAAGC